MTPNPSAPPIVWAVFLGADTSLRLAHEFGITVRQAHWRFRSAVKQGFLVRGGRRRAPSTANEKSRGERPEKCRGRWVTWYRTRHGV